MHLTATEMIDTENKTGRFENVKCEQSVAIRSSVKLVSSMFVMIRM